MTVPTQTTNSSGAGTTVKGDEPLVITATVHSAVRHRRDCEGVQVSRSTDSKLANAEAQKLVNHMRQANAEFYREHPESPTIDESEYERLHRALVRQFMKMRRWAT
jgi:hypothetical protein